MPIWIQPTRPESDPLPLSQPIRSSKTWSNSDRVNSVNECFSSVHKQHNDVPESLLGPFGVRFEFCLRRWIHIRDTERISQLLGNKFSFYKSLFGATTQYQCFFKRFLVLFKLISHYCDILAYIL